MRSAALVLSLSALALAQSQSVPQDDAQTVTAPTVVSVVMSVYSKDNG